MKSIQKTLSVLLWEIFSIVCFLMKSSKGFWESIKYIPIVFLQRFDQKIFYRLVWKKNRDFFRFFFSNLFKDSSENSARGFFMKFYRYFVTNSSRNFIKNFSNFILSVIGSFWRSVYRNFFRDSSTCCCMICLSSSSRNSSRSSSRSLFRGFLINFTEYSFMYFLRKCLEVSLQSLWILEYSHKDYVGKGIRQLIQNNQKYFCVPELELSKLCQRLVPSGVRPFSRTSF